MLKILHENSIVLLIKNRPRLVHLGVFLLLFICTFMIYAQTFDDPFHFDDKSTILLNNSIRVLSDLPKIFSYNPSRFVSYLSLAINYHLGKEQVFGYHLVNFCIHLINGFLVYLFILLLLKTPALADPISNRQNQKTSAILFALFGSLVFISHPLQTQAVTYIWQRTTSLLCLFYLLSMVCYLQSALYRSNNAKKEKIYLGCTFLFALIAMFTKQNAFTLPFALFLLEIFFISSIKEIKNQSLKWLLFSILLAIIPIFTFIFPAREVTDLARSGDFLNTPWQYFLTQGHVLCTYLRLLIFPFPQNLDYDYPIIRTLGPLTALAFGFLTFIFLFGFKLFPKNRLLSFAIFFFFLTLSIESSFIPLEDVIFEHRLYLPMLAFVLILSQLSFELIHKTKRLKRSQYWIFLIIPFVLFASYKRNQVWKSEESLWNDVIVKSPQKPRGYLNLAVLFSSQGKFDQAISIYEKALQLNPKDADPLNNMGNIYVARGEYEKALKIYDQALILDPKSETTLYNKAVLFHKLGQMNQAVVYYQKTLRMNPINDRAHYNLGALWNDKGDSAKAFYHFQKTIEFNPENAHALFNLATLYFKKEQYLETKKLLEKTLKLIPNDSDTHYLLAGLYKTEGNKEQFYYHLEKAHQHGKKISPQLLNELQNYKKSQMRKERSS